MHLRGALAEQASPIRDAARRVGEPARGHAIEEEQGAGWIQVELRVAAVGQRLLEPMGESVDNVVPAVFLVLDELFEDGDRRRS